jgi:hypothetical protein
VQKVWKTKRDVKKIVHYASMALDATVIQGGDYGNPVNGGSLVRRMNGSRVGD